MYFPSCQSAFAFVAETQIIVTPSSNKRIPRQQPETFSDAFHHTARDISVDALTGDANPDAVKLGSPPAEDETHPLAGILLSGKSLHAASLDGIGKLFHFLVRRDSPALTAGQRGLGLIDMRQYLQPPTFPLFPKQHGFPHRAFLVAKAPALDGLADKRLLVRSELHVHTPLA
jgi:hypothetical protein